MPGKKGGSGGASRAGGDLGGAIVIGTAGLVTGYYNRELRNRKGGDVAGAAVLEALGAGIVVAFSNGQGLLFNAGAGVLGAAVATLAFG